MPTILLSNSDGDKDKRRSGTRSDRTDHSVSSPQFILKTRDAEPRPTQTSDVRILKNPSNVPNLSCEKRMPLIAEDGNFNESILEYLTDQSEFLVIGCIGYQGVGKSTIMSHLINSENEIFPPQSEENVIQFKNRTSRMELFVTKNRVIFLDTPPILSLAVAEKTVTDHKKGVASTSMGGGGSQLSLDFAENNAEISSLQQTCFLFSICHVVILVQDWFYDANFVKFVQCAEMLKPPLPTMGHDEGMREYFPHVIFIHNKCGFSDFSRNFVRTAQDIYSKLFEKSRLKIASPGLGLGSGSIMEDLNPDVCGEPVNLYLLPDFDEEEGKQVKGHPGYSYLLDKLKRDLLGIQKTPLTHSPISEKNWFQYSSKVWETIKSSSYFYEYDRLLMKFETE